MNQTLQEIEKGQRYKRRLTLVPVEQVGQANSFHFDVRSPRENPFLIVGLFRQRSATITSPTGESESVQVWEERADTYCTNPVDQLMLTVDAPTALAMQIDSTAWNYKVTRIYRNQFPPTLALILENLE